MNKLMFLIMPIFADDFGVNYEAELAEHQSVECDIHWVQKVVDDTNMAKLQLENDTEALKEELLFIRRIMKRKSKD